MPPEVEQSRCPRFEARCVYFPAMMNCRTSLVLVGLFSLLAGACDEPKQDTPPPKEATPATTVATTAPIAPKPKQPEKEPGADIVCAEGDLADFHHAELEAEVRRKLKKPEGDIKQSELKQVRSINLAKEGKVDYLDPCIFPHLTGVRDLFLGPGKLKDISLLANLTELTSLRASMNLIEDVTPLKDLEKLDRLDLGRTRISDVSALSGLKNLTELMLDDTQVKDVSPLASLEKLQVLTLSRTQVKDISVLKPLKELKSVSISGAPVEDPLALSRPGLKVTD